MGILYWTKTDHWLSKQEQVLTNPVDHRSMQCLDYIMQVRLKSAKTEPVYEVEKNLIDVEQFFVDHQVITQLSDHYALKAVILGPQV